VTTPPIVPSSTDARVAVAARGVNLDSTLKVDAFAI